MDEALVAYDLGINEAITQVTTALAQNAPIPSDTWWSLDNAGRELKGLYDIINGEIVGFPKREQLTNPEAILPTLETLIRRLKSISVSLEVYKRAPLESVATEIGELEFGEPQYNEDGSLDYAFGEAFEDGIGELDVIFTVSNFVEGQELFVKVYIDENEAPSWRVVQAWTPNLIKGNGIYLPIAISYSDTFVMPVANYQVEVYVDGVLAQIGYFTVSE